MWIARPLILVLRISKGFGIEPALEPFRYSDRDLSDAVARSIGSHSRTREVCVAFRRRSTGGEGVLIPYVFRIRFCKAWNSDALVASAP